MYDKMRYPLIDKMNVRVSVSVSESISVCQSISQSMSRCMVQFTSQSLSQSLFSLAVSGYCYLCVFWRLWKSLAGSSEPKFLRKMSTSHKKHTHRTFPPHFISVTNIFHWWNAVRETGCVQIDCAFWPTRRVGRLSCPMTLCYHIPKLHYLPQWAWPPERWNIIYQNLSDDGYVA